MTILSLAELRTGLGGPSSPVLLDVRLPEDFAAGHLPGAEHACVFQVDFVEVVERLVPDRGRPVVVYGADDGSHESRIAAEKLHRLGYVGCGDFRGGVAAWREAGLELEGAGTGGASSGPGPATLDGPVDVDLAESRVVWVGRNLLNSHWGTVALTSGRLEFARGRLTGGEFTIDLRQIECRDLAGTPLHAVLIAHLQSDDFFDVGNFPEARFVIAAARPAQPVPRRFKAMHAAESPGGSVSVVITATKRFGPPTPGGLNLKMTGNLTLRGQTHPVTFWASAGRTPEGRPAAQATLAFDRTRWGALYGSGKFFRRLAGHLVNDQIELQVRIVGAAQ